MEEFFFPPLLSTMDTEKHLTPNVMIWPQLIIIVKMKQPI